MRGRPDRSDRRRWALALLLALSFHALGAWGLALWQFWAVTAVAEPTVEPIEFVFTPTSPESAAEPRFFSELPEDRVDLRPDQAEALSNVDSRARDRVAGGEDSSLPRLEGSSEAMHVGMAPQTTSAAGAPTDAAAEQSEAAAAQAGLEASDAGRSALAEDPRRQLLQEGAAAAAEMRLQQAPGANDIFQEEMENPQGNAGLFGNVSLNTWAWEYAPWLKWVRRELDRNWRPPHAFWLGLLDGGTMLRVVVARDGTLVELEVLEQDGHESLHQASVSAFRAMAPFPPLPEGFPEDVLVMGWMLRYIGPRR